MKKTLGFLIIIILVGLLVFKLDTITDKLASLLRHEPKVIIGKSNSFYKDYSYKFIQLNKDYIPYSKQDLKNIFFSVLNSGYNTFTFYCPSEYVECISDVNLLSSNSIILTHVNNFISPFNNFSNLRVIYDEGGEVTIEISKLYSYQDINEINNKIDEIIANNITEEMPLEDKVLAIHDYIINNTRYDEAWVSKTSSYRSNVAYGPLLEGWGICGGYADAMALFLNRWGIPNYKVASETHVWNALYINEKWLHLDLTWDDPVSEDRNKDTLLHKFYLIDTKTLEDYKITDHEFDKTIYQEVAGL